MFIQTEATPNPATLKFLPGRPVLDTGTLDMPTRDAAAQSPLAEKLFDLPNVGGVFYGADFISVTKTGGDWQQIKPAVLGAIMEHFMSGAAPARSGAPDMKCSMMAPSTAGLICCQSPPVLVTELKSAP